MDVEEPWVRIVGWCRAHAPKTADAIRPPLGSADIDAAEASTSGWWPDDLRAWYRLADGAERTPAGYVLPGFCPLPLHKVIKDWARKQEPRSAGAESDGLPRAIREQLEAIARTLPPLEDAMDPDPAAAGSRAGAFLPSFVPIAEDQSAGYLFVDTRPGPQRGCVTEWTKEGGDESDPAWPSVAAMLSDLAEGLHTGTPVGGWRPLVEEGELDWEVADDDEAPRP